MPPILYAVPVFMALLLIEVLASRWMGRDVYRVHDAVTSVNIGFISEAVRSLVKLVTVIFYALFVERVGTFQFDIKQPWVWVLAFFMYDFLYYWAHRAGHEVRLLWAAHVVHHSSEDFNLSTALRQSSTNQLFYWVFYVPMAVVGIPASVFVTVALLSAIYQFWVHTQLVPKLGWVDRIFVTPSNHRCHHGRNDYCIDVNYGATLIIWDRIFGTYAQERDNEPVVYGVDARWRDKSRVDRHQPSRSLRDTDAEVATNLCADGLRDRIRAVHALAQRDQQLERANARGLWRTDRPQRLLLEPDVCRPSLWRAGRGAARAADVRRAGQWAMVLRGAGRSADRCRDHGFCKPGLAGQGAG